MFTKAQIERIESMSEQYEKVIPSSVNPGYVTIWVKDIRHPGTVWLHDIARDGSLLNIECSNLRRYPEPSGFTLHLASDSRFEVYFYTKVADSLVRISEESNLFTFNGTAVTAELNAYDSSRA
jgi:hypothetical protein